jgi:pimeloyl-ACP methyl ester carboxylesterase
MRVVRTAAATVVAVALVSACSDDQPDVVDAEPSSTSADQPHDTTTDTTADTTTDTTPDATTDPETTATVPDTGPQGEPATFEVEPAEWVDCDEPAGFECATIDVPLDHADPAGATIPIALIRQPATGDDRIGSVVFNPGGPGGSGLEYLSLAVFALPAELAERFDLVSFDPRGVGASASVNCDLVRDDGVSLIADDDRAAWDAELADQLAQAETCTTAPAGIAEYLGTNHAARDLDLIRAAIGDESLTYVGFSYGTRLGATYAELFPDRIRAVVLDGGVAPSTDFGSLAADQGAGFDAALVAFADACDADADCLLQEIGPTLDVIAGIRAEIREVGSFETDDPARVLTAGELDLGIISALYSQGAWPYLAQAIYLADTLADGTLFQVLADLYLGRQLDGTYTNQIEAGSFINCADDAARPDVDAVWAEAEAVAEGSEFFDEALRASFGCLGTPDPIDPLLLGPAVGAPPILVIGTTGDPATPYEWSVQLAEFLDSGVLYTVEGEGHTAYTSIDCVTEVVNAYLIDLEVPAEGGSCVDDTDPDSIFVPVGESEVELVVTFFECLAENGADVPAISIADVLRDPSGETLLADIDFADPNTIAAVGACQSLLPV